MKTKIPGIHHVTAISGAAQENLDFYTKMLGLRFVKKTVNFDDPGTYHLYYGNETGTPGTIMTFFPWANAVPGRVGSGMTSATAFSIPESSIDYWMERFADAGYDFAAPVERFDDRVLGLVDPHGLPLELVAHADGDRLPGWADGPADPEHAIRSFHGVTLNIANPQPTATLLTEVFGYEKIGDSNGRLRFQAAAGSDGTLAHAAYVDLVSIPERGRPGKGTIHHVAFRVQDDDKQVEIRRFIADIGFNVTPVIDRNYFHSIYFREPGGVLFEIATDPPGFTADESLDDLGTALKLPAQHEHRRSELEKRLPALRV